MRNFFKGQATIGVSIVDLPEKATISQFLT
jgi:hypothetical protein